jgi:thiol:disulfide interchange protein
MKHLIFLLLTISLANAGFSQEKDPVKWNFSYRLTKSDIELKFTATINSKWHMYGTNLPEGGPVSTSFHFDSIPGMTLIGSVKEITLPAKKKDPNFDNMEITVHSKKAVFIQKVRLHNASPITISGFVEYMVCNDQVCLPPKEKDFSFKIYAQNSKQTKSLTEAENTDTSLKVHDSNKMEERVEPVNNQENIKAAGSAAPYDSSSLLKFFLLAFLAGLAGALTPCVYPMIPLTVMFFLKNSEDKKSSMVKGLIFGISIIIIYLVAGLLLGKFVTLIATHWLSNLLFFILFTIFAASFLGMYEIVLPGSLSSKVDKQVDRGGFLGIFFMALALVIVSFSCTLPIVSYVLVEGSANLKLSVIGMTAYSLAFALPFTFFALFPALLKSLPKSGGWLNSVKVILGLFIFLFGFKFIVIIDQSYHFNILNREIILSLWISVLVISGFYLLGKIKLAHDSELQHITVPRVLLSITSFTFAIYLFFILLAGGNIVSLASFLPSNSVRQNALIEKQTYNTNSLCGMPKYSDLFSLPYGMKGYFDYKEGLECAKQQNKPMLIDFKGHSCSNCKMMEAKVFSNPEVLRLLSKNYIIVALYTDDRTKLPADEWIIPEKGGKVVKTIGRTNEILQIKLFHTNALPLYAVVDPEGKQLVQPIGLETDINKFLEFLNKGLNGFDKSKKNLAENNSSQVQLKIKPKIKPKS